MRTRCRPGAGLVAAALVLAGCSADDGADLPDAGFPVFAPVLDGARPQASTIGTEEVSSDYGGGLTLIQLAEPGRDLCAALEPHRLAGDTCEESGSLVTTSMEEMSGVGLVREGTLLYWRGLVTEADPGLVGRAADALRDASRAKGDDLGDVSAGSATPGAQEATEDAPEVTPEPTGQAEEPPDPVSADDLDRAIAVRAVRHLAGTIGPREATGRPYARAADWVGAAFERLGYDVARQRVVVPAGVSWGVPVDAGRSVNVVATPPGFDATRAHLVVGAHLDTVPQAPGAEDNASGVGVVLAVAAAVAEGRTRLPVVFVAFGAEEPRGPSDDDHHHYGSRAYVAALGPAERRAVRAMVSLDRVGVGARVPVGSAGGSDPVQRGLLAAGRRAGVETVPDPDQRSSDHWSFVRAGLPGARLGSTSYAAYHDASDVPSVVSPDQLERTGRLLLAWLAPR